MLPWSSLPVAGQTLNYQGYLADADGIPVSGDAIIETRIHDADAGGTLLWQESHASVAVANGLFVIELGASTPFPDDLFVGTSLWLETVVNGETLLPRRQLTGFPFAASAQETAALGEAALETDMIAEAAVTPDKLATVCAEGEVLVMGASGWTCGAGPCVPRPEVCDGFDNDCDGVVDNEVCMTR